MNNTEYINQRNLRYVKIFGKNASAIARFSMGKVLAEEVQLEAIRQNYYSIRNIKKPTETVQLLAISQNPSMVQYIENPTEQALLSAVLSEPYIFMIYMENPIRYKVNQEMVYKVIEKFPKSLSDIKSYYEPLFSRDKKCLSIAIKKDINIVLYYPELYQDYDLTELLNMQI